MNFIVQNHVFLPKWPVDASVLSTAAVFVCVREKKEERRTKSLFLCAVSDKDLFLYYLLSLRAGFNPPASSP